MQAGRPPARTNRAVDHGKIKMLCCAAIRPDVTRSEVSQAAIILEKLKIIRLSES
jgi:hypothetical protein